MIVRTTSVCRAAALTCGQFVHATSGGQAMRKLRLAVFPLAVAVMEALGTASAHGYLRTK